MFTNYIKVIYRNFKRNKLYAFINTLGLGLGYAAFILIVLFLTYETSFENFHSKSDRIYRPTYHFDSGNGFNVNWARIPVDYINELPNEFPEVEKLIRFQNQERKYVRIDENNFRPDHAYITDPEVFEVFDLPLRSGNPSTALKDPHSIVLTESLALKYFGRTDVLGEEIGVLGDWTKSETPHKITGVMKDIPSNTHLPIEMLISFKNKEERSGWAYVYIMLQEGASIEDVAAKMLAFVKKNADETNRNDISYDFQALNDIHLTSNLAREIIPNSNLLYVRVFFVVGLFILIIAVTNFINLSSAMFIGRSKELGLRKILGSAKNQLAAYFIMESVANNLFALLLGALIAFLAFPYFSAVTNIEFVADPMNLSIAMLGIGCICGALAGTYPILSLNSIHPMEIIKNTRSLSFAKKGGTINMSRLLVTLQFSISILLIGSAFIAMDQFRFLNEKNLGIEKEQIIAIPGVPDGVKDDYVLFKDRLNTIPGVMGVTGCMEVLSREIRDAGPILVQGINDDPDKAPIMDIQIIDHDYIDVLGIELLAGENIPQSLTFAEIPEFTDTYTYQDYLVEKRRAYLINETAMKQLGWQSPNEAIGQQICWSIGSIKLGYGPITGVIKDYHQESLKNSIDPTVLVFEPIWLRTFLIKTGTDHIQETVAQIHATWDDLFPTYPIEYHFLDDMYDALYKNDQVKLKLLYLLSGLATIIAFIGLFGLIAYSLQTRIKEIAIRKILGADTLGLIRMISKEYLVILVLSSIFSIPVSYYFVNDWLQNFAYKTDISLLLYGMTFLLIGLLILATTSLQTLKTSLINPADTLREE